jgi:hypothetical protein
VSFVVAGRPEWMVDARCRGINPDLFHPEQGDNAGFASAKAICAACGVREECLAYALDNVEQHGVWGGLTESERRKIRWRRGPSSRQCRWCGEAFTPTHGSQAYCRAEHSAAASSARKLTTRRVG